ncbi:CD40 ligand [Acanthochromis polyacanthus]|uniref:CD40 ligand n=1 Tax=Acanthochromis polyacanthus TaxID=80966 RepID=A0A3Q1EKB1_9TELE|nr:CD40 ligand [Acanthochromis polyacanthus]
MINTYQTSLAPPPVPPRLSRSQTVLIPAPLPSPSHTKVLIRFLVGVVVLHLLLSVGGFIFLYHNDQQLKETEERSLIKGAEARNLRGNGERAALSSDDQETDYRVLAHMLVNSQSHTAENKPGYLQWDKKHSIQKKIGFFRSSWLTIIQPGDYFVYARVTFSKNDPVHPLESIVKLRKNNTGNETDVMAAYCDLDSSGSKKIPRMCTATQGQLITLQAGNQLSVWVRNLFLVNYEDGATTFGMYKL